MRPIRSLKEYESRYKNYKRKLFRFTKKEVEDFDKAADTIGEHYVLKHRKWVLFGDTYYEIPKPIRLTWFKGLSAAGKLGACSVLVGSAGVIGGGAYGIYALMNRNSSIVVIDSALQEYIKVNSVTKNSDGDTVVSLELIKDPGQSEADPAVYKGDHLLEEGKDYKSDFKSDTKIDLIISKEAMEKYPGKIIIKASKKPEKEITKTQFLKIIDDLNAKFVNSEDEYSIDKISNVTIGTHSATAPKTIQYTGKVGSTRDFVMTVGESDETSFTITSDKVKDLLLSETEGGVFNVFDDFIMYTIGEGASLPTGKTYCSYLTINYYGYVTFYEESKDGSMTFTKCATFEGGPEEPEIKGDEVEPEQWDEAFKYLLKDNIFNRNVTVNLKESQEDHVIYYLNECEEGVTEDDGETYSYTRFANFKYYTYAEEGKWEKIESGEGFEFDDNFETTIDFMINKGIEEEGFEFKDGKYFYDDSEASGFKYTAVLKYNSITEETRVVNIKLEKDDVIQSCNFSDYDNTQVPTIPEWVDPEPGVKVDSTQWNSAITKLIDETSRNYHFNAIDYYDGIHTYSNYVENNNICEYDVEKEEEINPLFQIKNKTDNTIYAVGGDGYIQDIYGNNDDPSHSFELISLFQKLIDKYNDAKLDTKSNIYTYSEGYETFELKFDNKYNVKSINYIETDDGMKYYFEFDNYGETKVNVPSYSNLCSVSGGSGDKQVLSGGEVFLTRDTYGRVYIFDIKEMTKDFDDNITFTLVKDDGKNYLSPNNLAVYVDGASLRYWDGDFSYNSNDKLVSIKKSKIENGQVIMLYVKASNIEDRDTLKGKLVLKNS